MRTTTLVLAVGTALAATACSSTPYNPNYQQTTQYKGSNPYATNAPAPVVQQAGYTVQTQAAAPISYQPQAATYTQVNTECLNKEGNRKMIGTAAGGVIGAVAGRKLAGDNKTLGTVGGAVIGGAAGYGIADKTINCDPIPISAPQQAVITPAYTGRQAIPASTTTVYADPATTPGIEENVQSFGDEGTPGYYAINGYPQADTPGAPVSVVEGPVTQSPLFEPAPNPAPSPTPSPVPIDVPAQTIQSNYTGFDMYTVQPGNTVYSLARESCVSVAEFKELNGINAEFYIRAGDAIKIPTGRCAAE